MRGRLLAYVLLSAALAAGPALAAPELATVFDVQGRVEVRHAGSDRWTALKADAPLRKGDRLRTGPESAVRITFDRTNDRIVCLHADSQAELRLAPNHFVLAQGRLSLVLDSAQGVVVTVTTRDFRVYLDQGGAAVATGPTGSQVSVFGGNAKVNDRALASHARMSAVDEGFKYFSSIASEEARFERMRYPDYAAWQTWVRSWYRKKDDRTADMLRSDAAARKGSTAP